MRSSQEHAPPPRRLWRPAKVGGVWTLVYGHELYDRTLQSAACLGDIELLSHTLQQVHFKLLWFPVSDFSNVLASSILRSPGLGAMLSAFFWSRKKNLSLHHFLLHVLPIGVLFAGTLWLGNAAYLYLSVSFIQMAKAFMPVLVYFVGLCFQLEEYSEKKLFNLIAIVVGTIVAAYGELNFHTKGFIMLSLSLILEAIRICMLQILLQNEELKMNSLQTMMYVAPVTAIILLPLSTLLELPALVSESPKFGWTLPMALLTNSCVRLLETMCIKIIKEEL